MPKAYPILDQEKIDKLNIELIVSDSLKLGSIKEVNKGKLALDLRLIFDLESKRINTLLGIVGFVYNSSEIYKNNSPYYLFKYGKEIWMAERVRWHSDEYNIIKMYWDKKLNKRARDALDAENIGIDNTKDAILRKEY